MINDHNWIQKCQQICQTWSPGPETMPIVTDAYHCSLESPLLCPQWSSEWFPLSVHEVGLTGTIIASINLSPVFLISVTLASFHCTEACPISNNLWNSITKGKLKTIDGLSINVDPNPSVPTAVLLVSMICDHLLNILMHHLLYAYPQILLIRFNSTWSSNLPNIPSTAAVPIFL